MKKVPVSRDLLTALLEIIENSDRIIYSRYDRKTKAYIWNDDLWKKSDPHTFRLVTRARAALAVDV